MRGIGLINMNLTWTFKLRLIFRIKCLTRYSPCFLDKVGNFSQIGRKRLRLRFEFRYHKISHSRRKTVPRPRRP